MSFYYTVSNYGGKTGSSSSSSKEFIDSGSENALWRQQLYRPTSNSAIATIAPAQPAVNNLYIPGNIYVGGELIHASDRALKTNLAPLADGNTVARLLHLAPKQYQRKLFSKDNVIINTDLNAVGAFATAATRIRYGFIAQEVESVFPELVHEMPDGHKSVDYMSLIPVVVQTLQEQHATIQRLSEKIERLESALAQTDCCRQCNASKSIGRDLFQTASP